MQVDAVEPVEMQNCLQGTVATKPAFREALKKRRCLIPADGFYEWSRNGTTKTPSCFTMDDDSIFAFAGIWEQWKNPEGRMVETCSIITTTPNSLLADVHDRMPVILPDEAYDLWLDPGFQDVENVSDLLKPFNPDRYGGTKGSVLSILGCKLQDRDYAFYLRRLRGCEIDEFHAITEPITVADYCSDTKHHP